MHQRRFGRARDVSVVGQGTWKMEHDERSAAVAAIRKGLDLGMTHVDTAEIYGSGAVEEIVGEALAGRRDEAFLVSKVAPTHASYEGTLRACEKSLRRLRTDRLDVYLLHWPGPHPLSETIRAFEDLQRQGKIVAWGLSNFDVAGLKEAQALAGHAPSCNQVLYHLDERAIEHAVLPWCEKHDVAVVAYSPFAAGRFPSERTDRGRVLAAIARAHQATARQVALAFLLRNPAVFAIPKASDVDHVAENAGAAEIVLTADEAQRIDAAFPRGKRPADLPTL